MAKYGPWGTAFNLVAAAGQCSFKYNVIVFRASSIQMDCMPKETALPLRVTKGLKAKLENFEFNELKPFACFAFPPPVELQNRQSVTWSIRGREQQLHFSRESNEQGFLPQLLNPGKSTRFAM